MGVPAFLDAGLLGNINDCCFGAFGSFGCPWVIISTVINSDVSFGELRNIISLRLEFMRLNIGVAQNTGNFYFAPADLFSQRSPLVYAGYHIDSRSLGTGTAALLGRIIPAGPCRNNHA